MKRLLLLLALAAVAPRQLLAQWAPPALADRRPFYVELRGGYHRCEIRYQRLGSAVVDVDLFPLAVGYYFTPRLAVQLSGAYGNPSQETINSTMQVPDGVYTGTYFRAHHYWAVPLLLRYAVLPRRLRLQADALLGIMWASDSYTERYQYSFNGTIINERTIADHGAQPIATVGFGLRYAFGRHFELLYDHAWNRNLDGAPPQVLQNITGMPYGLTINRHLALRYRFNWGKPASPPAATE